MNETDEISRAGQGDQAAWLALVQRHQTPVFRFAYLLLGSVDDAEDVAQATFMRAFRSLDRFDPARPLRPWLLQMAKHLASNRRRSVQRYLAAVQRWFQVAPDALPRLEESSAAQEEAQLLWQALWRLKAGEQEVIYLRYFLDLSVAETAMALDTAEGTVKSRLSRALAHLRAVVEQEFPSLHREQDT